MKKRAETNDAPQAGRRRLDQIVRLSIQQRNALGFIRDGNPFAGCVTANQRTGRQMTLWSLTSAGLARSNPWSLTVYGQEWLHKSNAAGQTPAAQEKRHDA